MSSIIMVVIVLAVIGVALWFITTLPMPPVWRNLIIAVVCIAALIWFASFMGWDVGNYGRRACK